MPHARFRMIACNGFGSDPANVETKQTSQGLEILDLDDWEKQLAKQGKTRPESLSQATWLLSTLPHEPVVDELIAAAKRPQSAWPMSFAEGLTVAQALDNPYAMPVPAISNVFDLTTKISQRARLAAQAGDGNLAFDLTQILWRFPEASNTSPGLVHALVGIAVEQIALQATTEALAAHCWSAEQMQQMAARMDSVNEEKILRDSLSFMFFSGHMWPIESLRKGINKSWRVKPSLWTQFGVWTYGPEGWLDCNMANSLEWSRRLLTPDIPGDDLIYLKKKMEGNFESVRQEYAISWPNPRRLLAACTMPALSNVADTSIRNQTRKRQLLFAIALERFHLKENRYPKQASELIPAYCERLPGDPNQPGESFQYQTSIGDERYRLISHYPDYTIAFPNSRNP